jgi:hypothetical protein
MSTQASRSTMTLWRCAATLALALAAGHVSAQLAREPDNAGEKGQPVSSTAGEESRPTKLAVPLTGTGVKGTTGSAPSSPKATSKSSETAKKGVTHSSADKDSPKGANSGGK